MSPYHQAKKKVTEERQNTRQKREATEGQMRGKFSRKGEFRPFPWAITAEMLNERAAIIIRPLKIVYYPLTLLLAFFWGSAYYKLQLFQGPIRLLTSIGVGGFAIGTSFLVFGLWKTKAVFKLEEDPDEAEKVNLIANAMLAFFAVVDLLIVGTNFILDFYNFSIGSGDSPPLAIYAVMFVSTSTVLLAALLGYHEGRWEIAKAQAIKRFESSPERQALIRTWHELWNREVELSKKLRAFRHISGGNRWCEEQLQSPPSSPGAPN